MKARAHDARRLDVAAAAREGVRLDGRWPLAGFSRLLEAVQDLPGDVVWTATASLRSVNVGSPRPSLHLEARAGVVRECQRCLQPVTVDIDVDRHFVFVADEATAAARDEDSEDDWLVLERSLDLHELVEDELLLGLPLVPRHERCPNPLAVDVMVDGVRLSAEDEAPNPFGALAALKRKARQ
jgi:uncharacterized protein